MLLVTHHASMLLDAIEALKLLPTLVSASLLHCINTD